MDADLHALLFRLLQVCVLRADPLPSPDEPPDSAVERETDEWCRRFARDLEYEPPAPEVAGALLPRLRAALACQDKAEAEVKRRAASAGAPATERALVEELLIGLWHAGMRAAWLKGKVW